MVITEDKVYLDGTNTHIRHVFLSAERSILYIFE